MRIVLDTNVVVSALLWRGTPYQLLEAIRQQPSVQCFSSAPLLQELADVLTRPSAEKRLAIISKSAREVLDDYLAVVELVEPVNIPRVVPGDPDDDVVIGTALAAKGDFLVTGDQPLRSVAEYQSIRIVGVGEMVQALQR